MSPVWLLLPLYLIPVVSHSEVLLTILIFTYILGILAIAFNIACVGQLTMFHGAAFGIGAWPPI
jgi:ABC-type branched-subunit amino acid transport system permease subunit